MRDLAYFEGEIRDASQLKTGAGSGISNTSGSEIARFLRGNMWES